MRKQFMIFAALCTAVCCLSACAIEDEPIEKNEYDALNDMLHASYSQVVLTVTDTFDESASLTSEYTIQYLGNTVKVNYSVEKFLTIDTSLDNPPTSMKTTLSGEAVIENGIVVSIDGDDVGLTADIAERGLTFQEEYFENVQLSGIYLIADVKNASGFLGTEITCTGMKIMATFLEVFYDINITYTSDSGNKVEYQYVFAL